MRPLWPALLLVLLMGCDSPGAAPQEPPEEAALQCLGSAELCERSYDEVSYLTSHNAMSNEAEGWYVPNHLVPIEDQLQMGVRALMLDIHEGEDALMLCHGTCLAGSEPLEPRLSALKEFLEAHPGEVLTLILESYVTASSVAEAFAASGLAELAHTQSPQDPWPTLGSLVTSNRRLLVFTDAPAGGPDWMLDVWEHAFETSFSVKFPDQFTCDPNRGEVSNSLFILNHFLSTPFADPDGADEINTHEFVRDRALGCWETHEKRPNFITVDFVTKGDAMAAIHELNQAEAPTDRTEHRARRR